MLAGTTGEKQTYLNAPVAQTLTLNANYRSNRMKFKAFLTQDDVSGIHSTKSGVCATSTSPVITTIFLHNLLGGDGVQSVAQFKKEILFHDYRISSQNDGIDVSLLHRALRSAQTIQLQSQDDTATIQIKLVKKLSVGSLNPAPFLTFETKGLKSAFVQNVPISKPLSRADVAQLQTTLDSAQDLPQV